MSVAIALAQLAALVISNALAVAAPLSTAPGLPLSAQSDRALNSEHAQPKTARVLFIVAENCDRCDRELHRLRLPKGDFESMRARGWKIGEGPENHLQIVERHTVADLIQQLDVHEYPVIACISDGKIVRSFKSGCTTPLDAWTLGFLAHR